MDLDFESIYYSDSDRWVALPLWARFYMGLGTLTVIPNDYNRLIIGISSPIRSYAASLIALGAVIKRSSIPVSQTGPEKHFARLKELPIGTPVTIRSGKRNKRGIYIGCQRRGWGNISRDCIGIQTNNKDGGNLIDWLPPERSLRVEVSPANTGQLPKNQVGRLIIQRPGFLEKVLSDIDVFEFALCSRFECAIFGNINRLSQETKNTRFAIRQQNDYFEGYLHDILRIRKFLGGEKSFRSDVYTVTAKRIPDFFLQSVPDLVIFDSAAGFLKWRDYLRHSHWVVLLDRTEKLFVEACDMVNQEYIQNRVENDWCGDIPAKPESIELIIFEEERQC